jgi:MFS transporter, YNFM family, putative membrane transport protein
LRHIGIHEGGMVLVGVGTFFAQATATGFVSRAATSDRGSASGLYLACYFFGGLSGAAILGQLFDRFGWPACVGGIGVSLAVAALLALFLKTPMAPEGMTHGAERHRSHRRATTLSSIA